jgi:hypothetical protein
MQTKIEQFAKDHLGIAPTKYQVELMKAVAEGKTVQYIGPRAGRSTALKIVREYLADGLKPAETKPTFEINIKPPEPPAPRIIFVDRHNGTRAA